MSANEERILQFRGCTIMGWLFGSSPERGGYVSIMIDDHGIVDLVEVSVYDFEGIREEFPWKVSLRPFRWINSMPKEVMRSAGPIWAVCDELDGGITVMKVRELAAGSFATESTMRITDSLVRKLGPNYRKTYWDVWTAMLTIYDFAGVQE